MARLALVMIVRDEARCIARCIESVRPHVDTMIVLDTGSVDDTIAIAERCGAEVHRFTWCDDFSVARNAALDHSDADWNLVLDADDWLAGGFEALGPETLPPASVSPARFVGCVSIVNQGVGEGGAARRFVPRVLPRGVRYAGRVHEQPVSALPQQPIGVELHHDGYAEDQLARKDGRNEALLRAELADHPGDAYLWHQLGRELLVRGRSAEAADPLLQACRLAAPGAVFRHSAVVSALRALKQADRLPEALALADEEQVRWSGSPDFYFAVADVYLECASREPARAMDDFLPVVEGAWKRCIDIGEQPALEGSVPGCGSWLAAGNLAMLYRTLGIDDEADEYELLAGTMRKAA
ncbi:MAG: glycosyltransferase family 2 protein [Sphingomonas sp.]|nr:glycosyltransferase family 2 protein [Sphingomonas sp.]